MSVLGGLACAVAGVNVGALAVALARASRRAESSPWPRGALARAVLVRPCAGDEPDLEARLTESAGAARVVLAVESATDPAGRAAVRAVEALRARGEHATVVQTFARGPNHKADQLARALGAAPLGAGEILVVADSDVDLAGVDLAALVGPIAAGRASAVWAPPVEVGRARGLADHLSHAVLDGSLHSFPLLAGIDPAGMVGKLFAIREDALREAGGFEALVDVLGEDMELSRRLRRAGRRVETSALLARSRPAARTVSAVVDRLSRWLVVVRAQRSALLVTYPLLFAPLPVAMLAIVAGAALGDAMLAAGGAALVVARVLAALAARPYADRSRSLPAAIAFAALGDATLTAALVRALVVRTVTWRGRSLRVSGARLEPAAPGGTAGGAQCRGAP